MCNCVTYNHLYKRCFFTFIINMYHRSLLAFMSLTKLTLLLGLAVVRESYLPVKYNALEVQRIFLWKAVYLWT